MKVKDWAIASCTTHALCTLHEEDGEGKVRLRWPPELERFFRSREARAGAAPERTDPLKIVSPSGGSVFRIAEGVEQQIAFKVEGPDWQLPVSWFCDDLFDRTQPVASAYLWTPQPGRHRFTCATADGESDTIEIVVERP